MITLLLVVIYVGFIGLGLPHSLFGVAWPAIQADFGAAESDASFITVLISGCTVISSMLGARLTKKFGTARVVTAGTLLAAGALLGFSFSNSLWLMCIFAVPLGLSAGATDSSLNNYIALNYSAMHMNFLHCFYGIGVMTSPYLMSVILDSGGWKLGYRVIFYIQCAIALTMILALPLWKRVGKSDKECDGAGDNNVPVSYIEMAKNPAIRLDWLMCVSVNAIEGVGGIWAATYLIYSHGLTGGEAAGIVTLFYVGMALGRFLSGLLSKLISSWGLIKIGTVVMLVSIAVMFIPAVWAAYVGLFLLGLGNGPVYPNIMHLTPRHFGEERSNSVIGSQMATAYFGIMIAPPIFAFLAEKINPGIFPIYIAVWLAIFAISAFFFLRKIRSAKA